MAWRSSQQVGRKTYPELRWILHIDAFFIKEDKRNLLVPVKPIWFRYFYEKSADGRDDSEGYLFDVRYRYRFRSIPHQHAVARTLDNSKNPPTPSLTTSRWFQIQYYLFSPLFGEDFQFDWYFSDGLKPPTSSEFACGSVYGHSDLSVLCNLYRLTRWFWQGPGVGVFRDRDRVQLCLMYEFTNDLFHLPGLTLQCFYRAPEMCAGEMHLKPKTWWMAASACSHTEFLWWPSTGPSTWFVAGRLLVSHAREVSCILGSLDLLNETTAHCNVWLVVNVPWFMLLLPILLDPMPAGFLPSNHVIASSRNSFAPVPEMEAKQRLVISDSIAETQSKYEGNISSRWWIVYGSSCQLPKEV